MTSVETNTVSQSESWSYRSAIHRLHPSHLETVKTPIIIHQSHKDTLVNTVSKHYETRSMPETLGVGKGGLLHTDTHSPQPQHITMLPDWKQNRYIYAS